MVPSPRISPNPFVVADNQVPDSPSSAQVLEDSFVDFELEITSLESYMAPQQLKFVQDPNSSLFIRADNLFRANSGPHALKASARTNLPFLLTEGRLCDLYHLSQQLRSESRRDRVERRIESLLLSLQSRKEAEWYRQRGDMTTTLNTEMYFTSTEFAHPALHATLVTVLTTHLLFNLPRRHTSILLAGQRAIFRNSTELRPFVKFIPKDPRTIVSMFNLDPVVLVRLCCPECFALYEYLPKSSLKSDDANDSEPYPLVCDYAPTPDDRPCGTSLWRDVRIKGHSLKVPRRKQVFQDLRHWLARLLSRPGIEDLLEQPLRRRKRFEEPMYDFWDAMASYRCMDSQGNPFFPGPDPARILRLMFSFSLDGFNPFHMKEAKQTASSTGVWLSLLNLPLQLRFREENLFKFTIIPGERGPSMEQINHTLELLVRLFLKPLFDPGFHFSRTAKYPGGRTVQGELVPFICDMPAVRQAIGFSPQNSIYLCTRDLLRISDIENFDKSTWPLRDAQELRAFAEAWRDAPSSKARKALYETYGVRWTPFWELIYFNPIRMADMEPWHVFLLGLLQTFIRHTWGVDWKVEGGDGTGLAKSKVPTRPSALIMREWMLKIQEFAKNEDEQGLIDLLAGKSCSKNVSWHICNDLDLRTAGTKKQRADHVAEYISVTHWSAIPLPSLDELGTSVDASPNTSTTNLSTDTTPSPVTPTTPLDVEMAAPESSSPADTSGAVNHPADWPARDENQIEKLRKLLGQRAEEKRIVNAVNLATLRHLAWEANIRCDWSKEQKKTLCRKLRPWAERVYPEPLPDPRGKSKAEAHVLGKSVMETVGADMKRTQVPSWISQPPINWGSPRRGKLSANHWEVIGTIYLVFTLIQLWGRPGRTDRQWDMLTNYMDLVQSILLLTLKAVRPSDIESYNFHILRHLQQYKKLYPHARINPIHHAALHAGELLEDFGPIVTRNAGHYERSIYHMQELNTNMKFGELEATFLTTSCRAANLLALLRHDTSIQTEVEELVKAYESFAAEDVRGTRLANLASALHPEDDVIILGDRRPRRISERITALLSQLLSADSSLPTPTTLNTRSVYKMAVRGVRYTRHDVIERDSDVIYCPPAALSPHPTLPGRIHEIFTYSPRVPETESMEPTTHPVGHDIPGALEPTFVYAAIIPYGQLPEDSTDEVKFLDRTCRGFGQAGGYISSATLDSSICHVVQASRIKCHFAKLSMSEGGLIHILPLNRLQEISQIETTDNDESETDTIRPS